MAAPTENGGDASVLPFRLFCIETLDPVSLLRSKQVYSANKFRSVEILLYSVRICLIFGLNFTYLKLELQFLNPRYLKMMIFDFWSKNLEIL